MNTTQASGSTKFKVGLFTILGLILIGVMTVFVNDRPFFWRPCELVHINIEDATGLKVKSAVRSLGLQIGYLKTVELSESHVRLGICITAPVEVLPSTRAYIRGEGFLGDKFVELKPVKYHGQPQGVQREQVDRGLFSWLVPNVYAQEEAYAQESAQAQERRRGNGRDIPVGERSQDVQQLVQQVDGLVSEMTALTTNLKEAINPKELRSTMQQLNKTLENASRTLSPEGGLNTTAQRTLAKLEDAIEQLRDQLTRVNKGQGSVGKLLNDESYAEEIRLAIRNVNRLLGQVNEYRFVVDLGAERLTAYEGSRGYFRLQIWPRHHRYYLLGLSFDPRGKRTVINTTTTAGGITTSTQTTQVEETGILLTGMLGIRLWHRLDLSAGALHGDGAVAAGLALGPTEREEMFMIRDEIYSRGQGFPLDNRFSVIIKPFIHSELLRSIYVKGGLESIRKVEGETAWLFGAGLQFDDQDIKLLFALR